MDYVIVDTKTNKAVSYPGSEHSFTNKPSQARRFPSEADANKDRCEYGETVKTFLDWCNTL